MWISRRRFYTGTTGTQRDDGSHGPVESSLIYPAKWWIFPSFFLVCLPEGKSHKKPDISMEKSKMNFLMIRRHPISDGISRSSLDFPRGITSSEANFNKKMGATWGFSLEKSRGYPNVEQFETLQGFCFKAK